MAKQEPILVKKDVSLQRQTIKDETIYPTSQTIAMA